MLRCLQMVEPMSKEFDVPVEEATDLVPDAGAKAIDLIQKLSTASMTTVICTHGEVIQTVHAKIARAKSVTFGQNSPNEKGSIWILEMKSGVVAKARYLPPSLVR